MSIFFSTEDKPCCKYCRNLLPERSHSGHCPHCGHWYETSNASVAPGRIRAVAMLVQSPPAAIIRTPWVWQGVAALFILVGNATLVVLFGRMAIRARYRSCGMNW